MVPAQSGDQDWYSLATALHLDMHQKQASTGSKEFGMMLMAYAKKDAKGFNASLDAYRKAVESRVPAASDRAGFETFFNHMRPFDRCAALYVVVFLLAAASWIVYPKQLRQAAFGLALLTLLVHTFALFGRMYLMGRPMVFVTNLYSSAIFIGWMCVILGLVLEWIFRNGLGCYVGAITGFLTLLVGYFLGSTGDTIGLMQAVLDTNFWLATHVTTVTIGYAATFVAGLPWAWP